MEIQVGPYTGEPRAFFEAGEVAFGERLRAEDIPHYESTFEADRAIVAMDGERIIGTAGIISFDLTVPDGALPTAGITFVGVHPTHRRRGILRQMMRAQLDAIHERGEPLAALWASEGGIYQRFGYGLATLAARVVIDHDRSQFRQPHLPSGDTRFVDVDEAARSFPPIYDALMPQVPGFFTRSEAFWSGEVFPDPEHWRHGAGPAWHLLHETDGAPDGYVRYRIRDEWEDRGPKSQLRVAELIADNPAAHLDLWRFLLDVDLMGRIEAWNIAPDDPLLLAAAEPRRLGLSLGDGLWLRIVDVGAALGGRRYRGDGRVVFEVTDEFCAWNAGRWALEVDGGAARTDRTTDAPDLAVDVTDLAAVYLGAFTFAQLAAARRAAELQPGALARADGLLRTDRAPWCPKVF